MAHSSAAQFWTNSTIGKSGPACTACSGTVGVHASTSGDRNQDGGPIRGWNFSPLGGARGCKILDEHIEDDEFMPVIFCMDQKDNWKDPKTSIKPNSRMGYLFDQATIQKDFAEAEGKPTLYLSSN